MAYSRFRRRRFGRRRRFTPRRFGRRNFRSGARFARRPARRRRVTVTPYDKKRDAIVGAHDTNSEVRSPITQGNTIFAFCPTYIQSQGQTSLAIESHHTRDQNKIHFTGYKERVFINSFASFVWRRVVLWSYEQLSFAQPPMKGADSTTRTRQITPIANNSLLRGFLFRGTQGIDYNIGTLHQATLNTANFTVISDQTRTINPNKPTGSVTGDPGKIQEYKFWYPGGRILYEDREQGTKDLLQSGWSTMSRASKGNMYIFDFFSDGAQAGTTTQIGGFQPTGCNYWIEG